MQYEISLPTDYDMGIIRHRVETKGHLLDTFPGLGLKAYLIREAGVAGSTVNRYAPFYLWHSLSGMNHFLWGGGGFHNILGSFGRPSVQNWIGVAVERGPARSVTPTVATRRVESLPAEVDPKDVVTHALDELRQLAQQDGVHTTALAIDPRHWELVRFTLWAEDAPEDEGTRFQVLHLSTPHLDEIPTGPRW
ncbi:protein of unknown function (DUF4865) [Streptoalloteichus tenebrarius]|uniref:DUF4865 domain-containing protein n=1 Tax=Streptoalloteichus tenebrarius (strain ATCC 17920 / DSM 40477 / JCM 4838 / CBS 697.72 / NBRC 16177 / NCIMB 11028 / NRRL B-12390 / A12253. 1 / ISP 5477) TaxID=1933 RepID=A0ABT1HTD6_STRSD|nr:DUF4865 family protein [Streptoalloteichus tenebrarius]MCP2258778.1 protein of unknown function (DUF4865) [Streptoalloteichus tenebrarius]